MSRSTVIPNVIFIACFIFVIWCLNRIYSKGSEFWLQIVDWISFCIFICFMAYCIHEAVYYFKSVLFVNQLPVVVDRSDIYSRNVARATHSANFREVCDRYSSGTASTRRRGNNHTAPHRVGPWTPHPTRPKLTLKVRRCRVRHFRCTHGSRFLLSASSCSTCSITG
jgi:hypothetical protein